MRTELWGISSEIGKTAGEALFNVSKLNSWGKSPLFAVPTIEKMRTRTQLANPSGDFFYRIEVLDRSDRR
jgi:hypothetical protein